ncbi:hypothetical protein SAMN05421771_1056 [Granulicella pectinivorans]|uniref:Uncharacterized protein n=1 Tax=Granulicella pectinivorans TaxID=474950 RepID=A0A1I6LP13_9BACT|nr:hypothetical protein [Granulicella pectinivorans]SFS05234.1 hypothetical protein SAMN05421771_1056 [Granulicella pectinivorans]
MSFLQLCLYLAGIFVVANLILTIVLKAAGKAPAFWLALQSTIAIAATIGFLGLAWGPLEDVQGLYSPTALTYIVQGLFVAVMVLGVGRLLGGLFDRLSGRQGGVFQTSLFLALLSPFYSHSVVWGALYRMPGTTMTKQATVVASGYQHAGRSRQTHGDWVDVMFAGERRKRHFISGEPYLLGSGHDACPLRAAHAGDAMEIEGRKSPFGFAATTFTPAQPVACPEGS